MQVDLLTIDALPNEILAEILSDLTLADRKLKAVCKLWKEVLQALENQCRKSLFAGSRLLKEALNLKIICSPSSVSENAVEDMTIDDLIEMAHRTTLYIGQLAVKRTRADKKHNFITVRRKITHTPLNFSASSTQVDRLVAGVHDSLVKDQAFLKRIKQAFDTNLLLQHTANRLFPSQKNPLTDQFEILFRFSTCVSSLPYSAGIDFYTAIYKCNDKNTDSAIPS